MAWDRNAAAPIAYTWRSKLFELPRPASFAACQVRADDYSALTLSIYADGDAAPVHVQSVDDGHEFHLPDFYACRTLEVQLSGTSRVRRVELAEDVEELR